MKATIGTIVVMGCVVGVLGWLAVERYRPRGELALLSEAERREPCVLEEVSCRGTPAGRVHLAVFPAGEVSAHLSAVDLTVSCVGSVPAPVWVARVRRSSGVGLVLGLVGFVQRSGGAASRLVGRRRIPGKSGRASVRSRSALAGAVLGGGRHGRARRGPPCRVQRDGVGVRGLRDIRFRGRPGRRGCARGGLRRGSRTTGLKWTRPWGRRAQSCCRWCWCWAFSWLRTLRWCWKWSGAGVTGGGGDGGEPGMLGRRLSLKTVLGLPRRWSWSSVARGLE